MLLPAAIVMTMLAQVPPAPPAGPASPAPRPALADPAFLEQYAATYRFSLGRPKSITVAPDGSFVLFLRSGARSFVHDLYAFDVATGEERVLVTADSILKGAEERLTAEERARRERTRSTARGIASYELSEDGARALVPVSGRLFVLGLSGAGGAPRSGAAGAAPAVTELPGEGGAPIDARFSPDGTAVACVRAGDLHLIDVDAGTQRRLTSDGSASGPVSNGTAEFVAQEEMDRSRGYWFSPDGGTIAYQQTDTTGLETFHIADPVSPEKEAEASPYPRPGKKNASVKLGLISTAGGAERPATTWVAWDRERYPYLASVTWEKGAPLTILVQNREQTEEVLLRVDPATGAASPLLTERDAAWVNIEQSIPRWSRDGSYFLWMTERGGAWQLEQRGRDGTLLATLTTPGFRLLDLVDLDDAAGAAYVIASPTPTERHLYRVPLDPARGQPERLTTEPGVHGATFGKGHGVHVLSSSTLRGEVSATVRRADGSHAGTLRSVGEEPPFAPELEITTVGADGPRPMHAAVVRPRGFDATRRYPVVVNVYGGPHALTVQSARRGYLLQQWIADHGFIVVSIDGRGTPAHGREWERAIKGNLIEVPLEDQAAGLRALGVRYPQMDLERVGIYGWSFGGYFSAMAVMRRPDVYRCGVAGAPVTEWLDYDTHYTERYLGVPGAPGAGGAAGDAAEAYRASSVLTYAKDLTRPLLIIHGTADDNVYFMHSLKLTGELFRAGRPFEFLPLAGFTHMVPDPVVTTRLYTRIAEYFVEHLGGPGGAIPGTVLPGTVVPGAGETEPRR